MGRFGRLVLLVVCLAGFLVAFQWMFLGTDATVEAWENAKGTVSHAWTAATSRTSFSEELQKQLEEDEIIPDVIDSFTAKYKIEASWPHDKVADYGNTLQPKSVKVQPKIKLTKLPGDDDEDSAKVVKAKQFVLVLTDPDAPSRESHKWGEFAHWIVQGVCASDEDNENEKRDDGDDVDEPEEAENEDPLMIEDYEGALRYSQDYVPDLQGLEDVLAYQKPAPPANTGKHRYVFLALTPANGTIDYLHLRKPDGRQRWGYDESRMGVRQWAREHGLVPVAANYIFSKDAGNDDE